MSNKSTNTTNVPEAREAMDKFKMEAASEVGVNLKEGYNGDLSSREAGSVGGPNVFCDGIVGKGRAEAAPNRFRCLEERAKSENGGGFLTSCKRRHPIVQCG